LQSVVQALTALITLLQSQQSTAGGGAPGKTSEQSGPPTKTPEQGPPTKVPEQGPPTKAPEQGPPTKAPEQGPPTQTPPTQVGGVSGDGTARPVDMNCMPTAGGGPGQVAPDKKNKNDQDKDDHDKGGKEDDQGAPGKAVGQPTQLPPAKDSDRPQQAPTAPPVKEPVPVAATPPTQAPPVQAAPVQTPPVQTPPIQAPPVQAAPVQATAVGGKSGPGQAAAPLDIYTDPQPRQVPAQEPAQVPTQSPTQSPVQSPVQSPTQAPTKGGGVADAVTLSDKDSERRATLTSTSGDIVSLWGDPHVDVTIAGKKDTFTIGFGAGTINLQDGTAINWQTVPVGAAQEKQLEYLAVDSPGTANDRAVSTSDGIDEKDLATVLTDTQLREFATALRQYEGDWQKPLSKKGGPAQK
ncbi:MAG: hypothetical protein JWN41_566, partial [Thermoleophilia bacterium]|nr:hypothetical protein [Thermoleophilia bacterium]